MTFPMNDYRVLITGSREWDIPGAVESALMDIYVREIHSAQGWRLVVVHGDCPTGADRMARNWAMHMHELGWAVAEERHPADWLGPCHEGFCEPGHRRAGRRGIPYCPAAGNWRNEQMAARGARESHAFYKKGAANVGTDDCASRARAHGIPVERHNG